MKRLLHSFLAVVILISAIFSYDVAFGSTIQNYDIAPTRLAVSNTYYQFDAKTKTLTISGTGNTPEFSNSEESIPWYEWRTTSIDRVVVEEGVTSIGAYMFYHVRATEFDLPNTIVSIGRYALGYTIGVDSWSFDFGLKSIGNYAFYCCSTMTSIELPESLTTIGMHAFHNCDALTSIELPYSVSSIGEYAFYNCSALTDVTYQSMSARIRYGQYAFLNCQALSTLTVPANGEGSAGFYGFRDEETRQDGISMRVANNSSAMDYAVANSIPYTTYDTVDIQCGVRYDGTFTESNMTECITYTFTPDSDAEYNIYTTGNVDVTGDIYCRRSLISEADDIADSNRNFCLTEELEEGVTYTIHVYSVRMTGDFCLYVLPTEISSFTARGTASFVATDSKQRFGYRHFDVTDSSMRNVILNVRFSNGFEYSTYYVAGFYDGTTMSYVDDQETSHFYCGDNVARMTIGGTLTAQFNVNIVHGYAQRYVEPTEDDDGYTLNYCVVCGVGYKEDFVPTTALHITGRCVVSDSWYGTYHDEIPHPGAVITIEGRSYPVNSDGTWSVNTFGNKYCYLKFNNDYGNDVTIMVKVDDDSIEYGVVPLVGYDINKDGVVNARDYAIYKRELSHKLAENYWKYGNNFLLTK